MHYERVLVATDFSPASGAAVAFALRFASRAQMHVVHVRAMPPPRIVGSPTLDDMERERRELHDDLHAWARKQGVPDAQVHLLSGSARREIPRQAETVGADLVVVGATGSGGLRGKLLGSTASHVARAAPTDVLVTRGSAGETWPRQVLVATDFESPAAHALARARRLAEAPDGPRVALAHVVDEDVWRRAASPAAGETTALAPQRKAAEDELAALNARELGGRAQTLVRSGRPVRTVADLAAEARADLCIVGTHGAGAFERALLGSVAEGVVEQAPCSVLVARG